MPESIWTSRPADLYGRRERDRFTTALWGVRAMFGGFASASRWKPSWVMPVRRTHAAVVSKRDLVAPDVVSDFSRIAVTIGREEEFRAAGLIVAPARTLYARRRGVLSHAPKRARTVAVDADAPPPTNRVKRGSVRPSAAPANGASAEAPPEPVAATVTAEAPDDAAPRPRNRIKRGTFRPPA